MFAQCTREMYFQTIGDLTASVFKVKWPIIGPCHYVLIDLALLKAIRGKHQFMWPFCPLPVLYFCFSGFTFHAGITLLQISYSFTYPSPPYTPKPNIRSPVWCLYFCPTLHWLHESIWIFPIDLWSCTLGTSRRFCGVTLRKNGWQSLRNVRSATYIWHAFNTRKYY